jgi:uncharacterized MAPEG superfamily protein
MTPDLQYLAWTAVLTASLWIPYVVSQVVNNGPLEPWGRRADRAYLNAVETFAPFAALVIVVHLAGKANSMTAFWAAWFFWFRLAHALVYLAGIAYLRTVVFTLAWLGVLGLFRELLR